MHSKTTRVDGLSDDSSPTDQRPMAPHSREQTTGMANFGVGTMWLLIRNDGVVRSFDRHTSRRLEFHFDVDRKRPTNGQYDRPWIRQAAQVEMFYRDHIDDIGL
jgi:hypothetical protein